MSGGKRQNLSGFDRKRAKRRESRPEHVDRYADKQMPDRLAALAEHFKSEERADERR